jgi:spermidine synthase
LFKEKSSIQEVIVLKSKNFGKVLAIDGIIQCTERDEFTYHEMIANIPILSHKDPQSVLIIGGGESGVLSVVCKHKSIKEIILCEIDETVVKASKEHFPQFSDYLKDERVSLKIEDGIKYLENEKDRFDIIIVDSSDPIGKKNY